MLRCEFRFDVIPIVKELVSVMGNTKPIAFAACHHAADHSEAEETHFFASEMLKLVLESPVKSGFSASGALTGL
jgi:hypothetical protein